MRFLVMKALVATMCGAALLAFGVAKAGEARAPVTLPAGYHVVQEDARISTLSELSGYEVINPSTLLIRAGQGLYLADLQGNCARGAAFDWTIAVDTAGGANIARASNVLINGRRCRIVALTKVTRDASAETPR